MSKLPITLVLIVRNSNGRLKQVIDAHRELVEEVVVVDQSSDDGTWEEANEHADYAIKRRNKGKCEGDRNFAFELGSQPWVLNLDDDEFMTEESKLLLPKVLESPVDVVWLKRKNFVDGIEMEFMGDDPQCRLFKRGALRWSDTTHMFAEKAQQAQALYSNVTINHMRTLKQIEETHSKRSKVLEPDKLELEKNFIAKVKEELSKGSIK